MGIVAERSKQSKASLNFDEDIYGQGPTATSAAQSDARPAENVIHCHAFSKESSRQKKVSVFMHIFIKTEWKNAASLKKKKLRYCVLYVLPVSS